MATGDQNIACFTIETSETFETLNGFVSFAGGSFRVDRRNFKRPIATSLDLRIKIKDKVLRGRESSFSNKVPIGITKKILPCSILDDFRWTVFKDGGIRNPRRCVG